jgi:two-component system response regulator
MNNRPLFLVDDDADGVDLVLLALRALKLPNPIRTFRDGEEVIHHLRNTDIQIESPAVIFLDVKLPKLSGFDVLTTIKSDDRLQCLPVVFLTNSERPEDVQRAYELGANGYVTKPADFERFRETIKQTARFWAVTNQATSVSAQAVK